MAKKNQNPNIPQDPEPEPKQTQNPVEPENTPVLKVGDIVTLKTCVGVVYENGNKGLVDDIRVQLADGTKIKFVPAELWIPAPKPLVTAFLQSAPDELKPEAIIAREAEELHLSVEEFMAGKAGGNEPKVEDEAGFLDGEEGEE